jgi:hypothetical protein
MHQTELKCCCIRYLVEEVPLSIIIKGFQFVDLHLTHLRLKNVKISNVSSYLTENILHLHFKYKVIKDVYGNNRCLF